MQSNQECIELAVVNTAGKRCSCRMGGGWSANKPSPCNNSRMLPNATHDLGTEQIFWSDL